MNYIRDETKLFPEIDRIVQETGEILKPHFDKKKYRLVRTEEKYTKNKYGQNLKIITKIYKEHEQLRMFE